MESSGAALHANLDQGQVTLQLCLGWPYVTLHFAGYLRSSEAV